MKIKQKLYISLFGLSFIIVAMFALTLHVTGSQKDDGLVINFAGRQRMVCQMIVKEVLYYAMTVKSSGTKNMPVVESIRHKIAVFDKTMKALKVSGEIPLSLDPSDTAVRLSPKTEEPVFSQLEKAGSRSSWETEICQSRPGLSAVMSWGRSAGTWTS